MEYRTLIQGMLKAQESGAGSSQCRTPRFWRVFRADNSEPSPRTNVLSSIHMHIVRMPMLRRSPQWHPRSTSWIAFCCPRHSRMLAHWDDGGSSSSTPVRFQFRSFLSYLTAGFKVPRSIPLVFTCCTRQQLPDDVELRALITEVPKRRVGLNLKVCELKLPARLLSVDPPGGA